MANNFLSALAKRYVMHRALLGSRTIDPRYDITAPFQAPWHIRTLIFPIVSASSHERWQLLFVNLFYGRLGIEGFDDPAPERGEDSLGNHLAILALTPERPIVTTLAFSRQAITENPEKNTFQIQTPDVLYRVEGKWPHYNHLLKLFSHELECSLETRCVEPPVWWSNLYPIYSHYSGFGKAQGNIIYGHEDHPVEGTISLEHGQGKNLLGLVGKPIIPVSLFHYQLGAFQEGGVFALGCFSTFHGWLETFRRGVYFDQLGHPTHLTSWRMTNAVTHPIDDRCHGTIHVPHAYTLRASNEDMTLEYEAKSHYPFLVARGRLTSGGAEIEGRIERKGQRTAPVKGVVYIEHLYNGEASRLP
jgi:hypothetical protein